jgi:hypothetical protein
MTFLYVPPGKEPVKKGELVINVKDYFAAHGGAIDGSADISVALQAAVDDLIATKTGGAVILPWGLLKWTAPVYFDSSETSCSIRIVGAGKGTVLLPYGFSSGDAMVVVNESRSTGHAKVLSTPNQRFSMESVKVDGTNSSGASLVLLNECHGSLVDMELSNLYYGLTTVGYCDRVELKRIFSTAARAGGWLFKQGGNGDGFEASQVHCYQAPGLYLSKCAGGTIDGLIGGAHRIEDSLGVTIENAHLEGAELASLGRPRLLSLALKCPSRTLCFGRIRVSPHQSK